MTIQPKVLLLGIGALVLIAVGAIAAVLLMPSDPKPAAAPAAATFVLRGTVGVNCSTVAGCSGYGDVAIGGQVEVLNQHNDVVAVGILTDNSNYATSYGTGYNYAFTVPNVPRGQGLYGVHVGNASRGVIWESESDAAATGFQLSIGH